MHREEKQAMKKMLLVLILIAGAFFVGRFFDEIKKRLEKMDLKPNYILVISVAIICLLLGIFIGKGVTSGGNVTERVTHRKAKSFAANKVVSLSDFESAEDVKRWKTKEASFHNTTDYAAEGKYSGEMVFFGGVQCSNIIISNFFSRNPRYGNWSGFSYLQFDIYNNNEDTERIILKIKDANDKSYQRNMYLVSKQKTEIKIYVDDLKDSIDPGRIRQVNFFRWKPKRETIFYIDNVRLIPFGQGEKTAKTQKDNSSNNSLKTHNNFLFDSEDSYIGYGVETSMRKVFLEADKFKGKPADSLEISMAQNEYESVQLAIYSKQKLKEVTIEKSDLVTVLDGKEYRISKNNIKCYVVGYVKTKKPGYSVSHVGWWPDPLEEEAKFDIERNKVQPVWVQVYTPQDASAGAYEGNIKIKYEDSEHKDIPLKVTVWNFALQKETHLKTAFDFYGGRLKRMYPQKAGESNQDYANRLYSLKVQYYLDMIDHRIMPVFNFEIKDAFFVKDINLYLKNGLSAFGIGKYSGSHGNNWPKDTGELNGLVEMYRDYAGILKAGGLIDKAYIYTYDEPKYGDPHVDEVTEMIHKADPDLKNMVCMHSLSNPDRYPGWGDDIDIWCVRNAVFNENMAKVYMDKGKEIWVYVSGPAPPYPTLVIDYPARAYRIVPWMCWKYDIKGYLYWCVNFWKDDPWQNTMNTNWEQNGNGLLYYPGEDGPVTSIRLEVTRDGLEDYEYLWSLKQKVEEVKDNGLGEQNQALLKKAQGLLNIDESIVSSMADYARDPEKIYQRRADIANAIVDLDNLGD